MSLDEVKEYALSDGDIRAILGKDTSVISYPQLKNFNDIDECFDNKGRCIILFLTTSPTSGHWCALLRKPDHIEFFDPYGGTPYDVKGFAKGRLEELDEKQPYLSDLMRQKGLPVYYNTHQFQKDNTSVSTCGRHCVVRSLYSSYPLEKYKKIIDGSGMSADDFVSGLTYDKLRK